MPSTVAELIRRLQAIDPNAPICISLDVAAPEWNENSLLLSTEEAEDAFLLVDTPDGEWELVRYSRAARVAAIVGAEVETPLEQTETAAQA